MGGTQRRGTVGGRAPPAGSVPHPSSAPVKATLFSGCMKMRNSIIKAIQKKEVRNGSRERFVVPQQGWVLPRLGSRLHMRSCKRLCPFPPPHTHLRGRGAAAMVTPSANIFSSFLAPEAA